VHIEAYSELNTEYALNLTEIHLSHAISIYERARESMSIDFNTKDNNSLFILCLLNYRKIHWIRLRSCAGKEGKVLIKIQGDFEQR
jgi:hypothetical protein